MDLSKVYWNEMCRVKDSIYYSEYYIKVASFLDKSISIIISFTSTATIANWVIWKTLSTTWAIILGLAQLFVMIKPFLPFNENILNHRTYLDNAYKLFDKYEDDFYSVWEYMLLDEEIDKKLCELRHEHTEIMTICFKKTSIYEWDKLMKWATNKTKLYMSKYNLEECDNLNFIKEDDDTQEDDTVQENINVNSTSNGNEVSNIQGSDKVG